MDNSWLSQRGRGIHLTIRDIDCKDFDVADLIATFTRLRVSFFSFFAAGYVTTYPSRLQHQRRSPWLGERDLTGEIIHAAHAQGIKAVPMIDLGQLPLQAAQSNPEWLARDEHGQPRPAASGGLLRTCPLGGYIREYCRDIVVELCERYDFDAMKFGGGSYGFAGTICHCDNCKQSFLTDTDKPLPSHKDWSSPAWKHYTSWRFQKTSQTVRLLVDMVHHIKPGLPVVGNAVCFGDPHWTLNCSLDMEELAEIQDIVQVETQTRSWADPAEQWNAWQYLRWPAETARYMSSVSNRPIWTVTSYFQAWPWRRAAVPVAEQRVFLAQMAANGASPMVNLSGGGPAGHEDKRGFAPIQELYSFMADNPTLFDHDRSVATIALLYDQSTLVYFGNDDAHHRYIDEFRGFEQALDYDHIPFDIVSTRTLDEQTLKRYRVLILPSMACISDTAATTLCDFVKRGGSLVCSFQSGHFDPLANPRPRGALDELLGLQCVAPPTTTVGEVSETSQVYMRRQGSHPVNVRLNNVELLPLSGEYCAAQLSPDTTVPWRRTTPFRLFPEGWSYTTAPDEAQPLQVIRTHASGAHTVWFASSLGRSFYLLRNPDLGHLIADTVRWVAQDSISLRIDAPNTLQVSLRTLADGRTAVHCVNLTGGERFFERNIPLHNLRIALKSDTPITRVISAASGQELPVTHCEEWYEVYLPTIDVYDIVLFSHT